MSNSEFNRGYRAALDNIVRLLKGDQLFKSTDDNFRNNATLYRRAVNAEYQEAEKADLLEKEELEDASRARAEKVRARMKRKKEETL